MNIEFYEVLKRAEEWWGNSPAGEKVERTMAEFAYSQLVQLQAEHEREMSNCRREDHRDEYV